MTLKYSVLNMILFHLGNLFS
uniref:Uncharacterized protein n=1 Tax=Anguilla anguilla TaxID=7936 RepID=A0A0E9Q7G5_ANGAN